MSAARSGAIPGGHVFVIRGDLTRLACDAVVIPCDSGLNVNSAWHELLPAGLPPGDVTGWLRLPEDQRRGETVRVRSADGISNEPPVHAVITTLKGAGDTPAEIAERLAAGVGQISQGMHAPSSGRKLPLIALPLVGSGEGGHGSSRAELIDALLPALRQVAQGIDIALVLHYWSDVAAVQSARSDEADWQELSPALRDHADSLGGLAAQDRLSLFIGAGVSRPVGLPDWTTLLEKLAAKTTVPFDKRKVEDDPVAAATPIKAALGENYAPAIRELLTTSKHAIGHALLAGLRIRQMVTTNFDQCMEHALRTTTPEFRVLTQKLANSSLPWLLKLHGDLNRPDSIVLTSEDYENQRTEFGAVYGVVESLMLTSHLLIVGFGLTDRNFLELATAVKVVRQQADVDPVEDRSTAGTALALTAEDAEKHKDLAGDLSMITMSEETDYTAAARLLEIFLDRVSWTAARGHDLAAEYLLDDRYLSGLSEQDRQLHDALTTFVDKLPSSAQQSAGWPRLAALLRDLGYRRVPASQRCTLSEKDGSH